MGIGHLRPQWAGKAAGSLVLVDHEGCMSYRPVHDKKLVNNAFFGNVSFLGNPVHRNLYEDFLQSQFIDF